MSKLSCYKCMTPLRPEEVFSAVTASGYIGEFEPESNGEPISLSTAALCEFCASDMASFVTGSNVEGWRDFDEIADVVTEEWWDELMDRAGDVE